MEITEGQEQRPQLTRLMTGCLMKALYAGAILLLILGGILALRKNDVAIFILVAVLIGLFLLPFVVASRNVDQLAYVYADHLVLKKRRLLLPGRKVQRLDYADIKKVREKWGSDLLGLGDWYKVWRHDGSRIRLTYVGDMDYRLFVDYCKTHGVDFK